MDTTKLLIMTVALSAGGCGVHKPTTTFTIDPQSKRIEYRNDKDMDFLVEDLDVDTASGRAKAKKIHLSNRADTVIAAHVQQMIALNEQMKIHGQNISNGLRAFASILGPFAPAITGAGGIYPEGYAWVGPTPSTQPADNPWMRALVDAIVERVEERLGGE